MSEEERKKMGQAIDEIIAALQSIDEDERSIAIYAACKKLNLAPVIKENPIGKPDNPNIPVMGTPRQGRQKDIREFKEEKKPNSANEMAVLVAFYLKELAPEEQRTAEIDGNDLEKYFKMAKYPLPGATKPAQILINAKYAGYFEAKGNGKYALNVVGYNLVEYSLPRSSVGTKKKSTKKKPKKTITKK